PPHLFRRCHIQLVGAIAKGRRLFCLCAPSSSARATDHASKLAPKRSSRRAKASSAAASGLASDPQGPLFRTIGRGTGPLTRTPLPQANAYGKIQRWAQAAGIKTRIGNNTFRATGMTTYLKKAWRERMYDACDTA